MPTSSPGDSALAHYQPVPFAFLICCLCTRSGREPQDVEAALHRAVDAYQHGQQWWRDELVLRAMRQDWSWSRSAHLYLDIYRSIMQ
jgi:hypothetical protein